MVSDIENASNIKVLLDEYALESAIDGMPAPQAKAEIYKSIERDGLLQAFSAHIGDDLIGFAHVVCSQSPKYGVDIANIESIFVLPSKRNTGAGIKLIRAAEDYAKSRVAAGIIISAPIGGMLDAMLTSAKNYVVTNHIFFRVFHA